MLLRVIDLQRPVRWGMTGYVRSAFRVRSFGLEHLRLEPSMILAPNHRSDNDVPLLVSTLGPLWTEMIASGLPWPTFAADDHALLRGTDGRVGPLRPGLASLVRRGRAHLVQPVVRRAIPLTAGQIAAAVLRDGGSCGALPRVGAEWIARAQARGRPIEPDLLGPHRRPILAYAFARARRRGGADGLITALAQELHSADAPS